MTVGVSPPVLPSLYGTKRIFLLCSLKPDMFELPPGHGRILSSFFFLTPSALVHPTGLTMGCSLLFSLGQHWVVRSEIPRGRGFHPHKKDKSTSCIICSMVAYKLESFLRAFTERMSPSGTPSSSLFTASVAALPSVLNGKHGIIKKYEWGHIKMHLLP